MGSSYGVGFIRHHARSITSREQALEVLKRFAEGVGESVCDVVDGVALKVWYWGSAEPIDDEPGAELLRASTLGDDLTYEELTLLDPYDVSMACDRPFDVPLPWKPGTSVTVQPLRWLREHLNELLARDDLPEPSRGTFRSLLETCEVVSKLDTILVIGD